MREIWDDGSIVESSFQNGENHGLYRKITPDHVEVEFNDKNEVSAYFHFDYDG